MQNELFDLTAPEPAPARKDIDINSRKAYAEILPTLPARESFVVTELLDYEQRYQSLPTAYELVCHAQQRWPDALIDVNTIRPHLTRLKNVAVEKVAQRECAVTGKTAWTWRVK